MFSDIMCKDVSVQRKRRVLSIIKSIVNSVQSIVKIAMGIRE